MTHLTEMLEEGGQSPDRLRQYYRALATETRRLQRLVESLLDFGRTEAGGRVYRRTRLDAVDLVRNVVDELRQSLSLPADRIVLPDTAPPVFVNADREALALVIRNLLDNAIKYSPDSSSVRVSIEPAGDSVAIAVSDDGPGMTAAEQDRVFRKFVRGDAARQLNVKGTGIGLTMARHIVEAHDGQLTVSSAPGRGSRFLIRLRAAEPAHL
jgi:signal transduction histidine kinase